MRLRVTTSDMKNGQLFAPSVNRSFRIPFKYKIGTFGQPLSECSMVIRLAELYLIRAEARAQLSKLNDGLSDLNAIRIRAGLPERNISSQPEFSLWTIDETGVLKRASTF